jgi:phage terminase large subunit-like protein
MVPTKDKQTRARSFQARLRAGGVRFDKDADWYPTLEDEMVRFPRDKHDDQVDALSWIGLTLDKLQEAPTPVELAEEEWEEMEQTTYESQGRSWATGY